MILFNNSIMLKETGQVMKSVFKFACKKKISISLVQNLRSSSDIEEPKLIPKTFI